MRTKDAERLAVLWTVAQSDVAAFLRSVIDSQHVPDLLQQVAVKLVRNFDRYDDSRPFTPWAIGIAKHEVLAWRRRRATDRLRFGDEIIERVAGAFSQATSAELPLHDALRECLQQVEGRGRKALDHYYGDGMPTADVAAALKMSGGALRMLLCRVRRGASPVYRAPPGRGGGSLMDELLLLIQAHLDGELTDEQSQQLQARLRDDPAALDVFVQTHRLDQQLRDRLPGEKAAVQLDALAAAAQESRAVSQPFGPLTRVAHSALHFFARPTPLSVTAAALFIGLLITALALTTVPIYQRWARTSEESIPVVVAKISGLHEAVWAEGQVGTHHGAHLVIGHRMEVQEGIVEITYQSGAEVLLTGPAAFVVSSARSGTLHHGCAVSRVSEPARGFYIDAGQVRVIDLGTEFGVAVEESGAGEVYVFEGRVEVTNRERRQPSEHLAAGETLQFDHSGDLLAQGESPLENAETPLRAATARPGRSAG